MMLRFLSAFGGPVPSGHFSYLPTAASKALTSMPTRELFAAPPGPGAGKNSVPFEGVKKMDGCAHVFLQSISAMAQFENKTCEEIRYKDYSWQQDRIEARLVPYFKYCPNGHNSPNTWLFFNKNGSIRNLGVDDSRTVSDAYFPSECLNITHTGSTGGPVPQYPEAYWKLIHISIPASLSNPNHFGHLPWLYCQFKALIGGSSNVSDLSHLKKFLTAVGLEDLNFIKKQDGLNTTNTTQHHVEGEGDTREETLVAINQEMNPSKMSSVDELLKTHEGCEETMFLKLA